MKLYRHYSKAGELLYIGIAASVGYRLRQHEDDSPWAADIARIEIESYPDANAARIAEREAIAAEQPKFNTVHKKRRNLDADAQVASKVIDAAGGTMGFVRLFESVGEKLQVQQVSNWRSRGLPASFVLRNLEVVRRLQR